MYVLYMAVTIKDVALRAGVSISTVSRVLNQSCPVASDKAERVHEAARELGYMPNPNARSLLSRRTGGIGVILPYVSGEFWSALLNGIDAEAQRAGMFLLISTSHRSSSEFKKAVQGMYKRVDGMLVMASNMTTRDVEDVAPSDSPVVFMNTPPSSDNAYSVGFDNFGGMYKLTKHLLAQGHRRIAFIKGDEGANDAEERLRGFREAMLEAGVERYHQLILDGGFSPEDGLRAANLAIQLDPKPSAIMASNDESALAVLAALRRHGIDVPGQIAVTGFDDLPSASYSAPSLTSASVPVSELGVLAVRILLERLEGSEPEGPKSHTLAVEVQERESSRLAISAQASE